jgi:hypothetical protein
MLKLSIKSVLKLFGTDFVLEGEEGLANSGS